MHLLARLAQLIVRLVVVVLVVTFVTFGMTAFLPGDPIDQLYPIGTEEQKEVVRDEVGLNDPFFVQYVNWLGGFVTGDFGKYYDTNISVNDEVKEALPVSLQLMGYSVALTLLIAVPLGVFAAYKQGSLFDRGANATAFGFLALPNFVLGLILASWIGAQWQILPTQGYVPFGEDPAEHFRFMTLPVIAIAASQIAVYMRLLRSDMIATLQEDFVTTAKAKGISPRRVLFRHALRPSSLTLLTVAGLNIGTLISGLIVIEVIFGLPGMGSLVAFSIFANQYVALQSLVAIIAVAYVVLNSIIDLLYTVVDPRIRRA